MSLTPSEMDAIFKKYDSNNNGKLDYEEFSMFFANRGSGNNPNVNPVFGISREPPIKLLKRLKNFEAKRNSRH